MDIELLFAKALGIEEPWIIKSVYFDSDKKLLEIKVDFKRGATFPYKDATTGNTKVYKAYDTVEKSWRHLNFFEHECYIVARTPRIQIEDGAVKLIMPPWAGVVGGFTMLFEALVLKMCANMPVHQVGDTLNVTDKRLWRILDCYIRKMLWLADHKDVSAIGMDETSARRGHNYISLFVDMATKKTIYIAEGKDNQTVHEFAEFFKGSNGNVEQVKDISCDMSPAFIKGATEAFPSAQITFDKFHITKLINEAVDEVRREEAKHVDCLKGARFAILKNKNNLTSAQSETRERLSKMNLKSMRAVHIRENFQRIYEAESSKEFKRLLNEWYFWATHCRIEAVKKVAKTIKSHWNGILQWYESKINNGILEGLNSVIQAAKRKARGYKMEHFKTIAYLLTGKLNFHAINPYLPTHFA